MCQQLKFVFTVAVVTACLSLSSAQYPVKPYTPEEEAMYLAFNPNEEDLLPNPDLVSKIAKMIVKIRKETDIPGVKKVRNQGVWYLGRVRVTNFSPELKEKIDKSEYGPLQDVKTSDASSKEAELIFTKPYHPLRLSAKLAKEFGAEATEVRYGDMIPNIGSIRRKTAGQYDFVEGCKPPCGKYYIWKFKVDETASTFSWDMTGRVG